MERRSGDFDKFANFNWCYKTLDLRHPYKKFLMKQSWRSPRESHESRSANFFTAVLLCKACDCDLACDLCDGDLGGCDLWQLRHCGNYDVGDSSLIIVTFVTLTLVMLWPQWFCDLGDCDHLCDLGDVVTWVVSLVTLSQIFFVEKKWQISGLVVNLVTFVCRWKRCHVEWLTISSSRATRRGRWENSLARKFWENSFTKIIWQGSFKKIVSQK